MALDIWCPVDIQRILLALASAGRSNGPGYIKALRDVGLAFGVADPDRPVEIIDTQYKVGGNGRNEILTLNCD